MKELRIIAAQDGDLDRFIDLMEELADGSRLEESISGARAPSAFRRTFTRHP
jgi:hypothetical protein